MVRTAARIVLFSGALAACAPESSDPVEASQDMVVARAPLSKHDVETAIATLDAHRGSERLARYYADGSRVEGCWRNPAGDELSELQKAFYCAMPLELRLCNTVELLRIDESKMGERYDAYLACQEKVDLVFGSTSAFVYDANVNAVYKRLFLARETLSPEETTSIVDANAPRLSSRPFPLVLAAIGATLTEQAADLALAALTALADDYRDETKMDPR